MKVLVACEFSGIVREAFNSFSGVHAVSCDILPCEDGRVDHHRQCDALTILNEGWDVLIAHPPCTYLTNSAEWAYKDPDFARYPGVGYHQKLKPGTLFGAQRRKARQDAVAFFLALWSAPIPCICIENPIGHMAQHIPKRYAQTIQPHQFGHDASKATCLWLKGLPRLTPTAHVSPRMVAGRPRWSNQTDIGQNRLSPADDRWATRSLTYPGIASAMASQWISHLVNK